MTNPSGGITKQRTPHDPGVADSSLPDSTMALYACGALGPATILSAVSTQLMIYWTDIAGIAPGLAGSLLFIAKAVDALTDIGVGVLSDRFDTRWGRRRPWILAGGFLLAASCATMFSVDVFQPAWVLVLSVFTVTVFFLGLSMAQVPHIAMAAEITSNYHERTRLSAYVYGSNILAGALGIALPPALIRAFGGGSAGFHSMALVVAPIPLLAAIICVWGTGRARIRRLPPASRALSAEKWLPSLIGNRPLMGLVIAKICTYFGASSVFTGMAYYTLYVARLGASGMIVFGATVALGNLAGLALVMRFFQRVEKHRLYGAGLLGLAAVTLSFAVAGPHRLLALFGVHVFIFGVFAAAVAVPGQSMIADVIEWDQLRAGPGREGAIASLVSAIQKTTPAFASLSIGQLLSWGRYSGHASLDVLPASAIYAIVIATALLPGSIMALGAIPLLFSYDLSAARLATARLGRSTTSATSANR
jgi:GPH family glycoside/pentoside/hexuronide:cation symporter